MTRRRAASAREPVLEAASNHGAVPTGRDALSATGVATRWHWLAVAGSAALHAGAIVALLLWPLRDPVEEPGEMGTVALVFDDTASEAGGAVAAAEPPAPPAPPAPPVSPAPPAPPASPQAAAPPPPPAPPQATALPPPPPQAAAPPPSPAETAPPAAPEAPRDFASLPPDPSGMLPPPPAVAAPADAPLPPAATEPMGAPRPDAAAAPVAPPPPVTPAVIPQPPPPEPPQAAAEPEPRPAADPLPLPPLAPSPQQRAAAQSAPPPRPASRPAAAQGPVRLDAGGGDMAEASLGSFAMGAVVPPTADAGHRNNPPDYPAEARRRGEEGVVRLSLRIGPEGQVTAAEVESSSGFAALDRAAVEAARRWRFRPAMRAGMPVAASLSTAMHFRLTDARGR